MAAPVPGLLSYRVPASMLGADPTGRALVGYQVLVRLGGRGVSGVIVRISDTAPPEAGTPRPIESLVSDTPVVSRELIALCLWIADYYEAPPGEALRMAQPVGSQVAARQAVSLTDAGRDVVAGRGGGAPRSVGALRKAHRELLGSLAAAGGSMTRRQLLSGRAAARDLTALIEAGLVRPRWDVEPARVQARTERVAVLTRAPTEDDWAALSRAPVRRAVLVAIERAGGAAAVRALAAAHSGAAGQVRALAKLGVVRVEERARAPSVADVGGGLTASAQPPELTTDQRVALESIRAGLDAGAFAAYLLHGITGSGKTEVYLHAIAELSRAGKSAIVLVPEISLTPQLAARFRARFGDRVAILHSGLTTRARFDEWHRLASGDAHIAVGARSAVFAPVSNLGIVVVDEEHDSSFKQEEQVRYHARDVALVRAQRAGAVCVLGSATPSLESYHAAQIGRYTLLSLPDRATSRPLPGVSLVDLRVYRPETEAMLTAPLSRAIADTLAAGDQVILFLNRRGFATFVLCGKCGTAFRCSNCSVSLTYHRARDRLVCHYCGLTRPVPRDCPECGASGAILRKGLGTERVAAAVAERFPDARVARLDRDVASGARIGEILARVARREVDILVGTQMVSKGHDFPGVTLVGVLCADTGLSLPDFRAAERTFQLITQVAGRAGRGDRMGRVLVQSYRTEAVAIAAAARHDYEGFFRAERAERRELGYPPFGYLAALRVDGPDPREVEHTARALAAHARAVIDSMIESMGASGADAAAGSAAGSPAGDDGPRVMGPSEAPLARLKGRTRWHVWLRAGDRKTLRRIVRTVAGPGRGGRGVRVTVDIDPLSAL